MTLLRILIGMLASLALVACQPIAVRPPLDRPARTDAATPPGSDMPPPRSPPSEPPPETPPAPKRQFSDYVHLPEPVRADATAADVLERLRAQLVDPPCPADPVVQRWIGIYGASQPRFSAQVEGMLPWLSMALDEAERYRLPGEFVLLPIVESGYQPHARGAGDHIGLWQIGRSTANYLGLPVTASYDGRLDGFASTDAALRYLAEIQNRIGDWKLTALGYNVGPYRVGKLLERTPDASFSAAGKRPAGLPASSYEHVARMQAWACLLAEPERHGLELPGHTPVDPLVPVRLPPGQTSLAAIAGAVDLDPYLLTRLNPAYRRGFVAREASRDMLLPASLAPYLETPFDLPHVPPPPAQPSEAGSQHIHVVERGDTLGSIARRHGVKLARLYQINGLSARSILRIGQRIRLAP